jgi:integrase
MANDDLIRLYGKYLERRKSATVATITGHSRTLRQADRELPFGLDAAAENEIEDWLWRGGLEPNSRSANFTSVVGFYRWAAGVAGVLTLDPTRNIERPKVALGKPRVAVDEHVQFIVTQASEPYRLAGTLAAYAGLRAIEIWRLHREHVTPDRLHVKLGKGNKQRYVPVHPALWDAVKDLPEGPVTDKPSPHALANTFLRYCQRAGMRNMSLHRMRGWFATRSYRACKDIRAVQANMGHTNPGVTARYIELDDSQVQAVIAGLPTFA